MKKLMLIFVMLGFIAFGKVSTAVAQEAASLQDSLSIDDMAPVFYEAEEESSSSSNSSTIIIVVIAVVVIGGGAFYFAKKKK